MERMLWLFADTAIATNDDGDGLLVVLEFEKIY